MFYRVQHADLPAFSAENAYSREWNTFGSDDEDCRRGYSCFEYAPRLVKYFKQRGVDSDAVVIVFDGDIVGFGHDGEELVVPSRIIATTTWDKFAADPLQFEREDEETEDEDE